MARSRWSVIVVLAVCASCSSGHGTTAGTSTSAHPRSTSSEVPPSSASTTTPPPPGGAAVPPVTDEVAAAFRALVDGGATPAGCRPPDGAWRASDPRFAWLLGDHATDAVDGFVADDGTVVQLSTELEGVVDGDPTTGSLRSSVVHGEQRITVDRGLVSITADEHGTLFGLTADRTPRQVVRIGERGATTVIGELPPTVELAGRLVVDPDGTWWVSDLTDIAHPQLRRRVDGRWESAGDPGIAAAHLVDPVANSRATQAGGTSFTDADGATVGAVPFAATRVPGSSGAALVVGDLSETTFLALLPDGTLRCAQRGLTERFVADLPFGGSRD